MSTPNDRTDRASHLEPSRPQAAVQYLAPSRIPVGDRPLDDAVTAAPHPAHGCLEQDIEEYERWDGMS
jgi:hypothetical protein